MYNIHRVSEFNNIIGGFIHVPFATEQVLDMADKPSLTIAQITKGLDVAIRTTINTKVDLKLVGGAAH